MTGTSVLQLPEIAFYYPNPYWRNPSWAKNIILFFDGIAMLIPNYKEHYSDLDDLAIITGLKEHNLFHVIEPEVALDKESTQILAEKLIAIIDSGKLKDLAIDSNTKFHYLSRSRMGYSGDETLAEYIFQELKSRGLAKDSSDGVSIPMHPTVRVLILVLLAQILRPHGLQRGLDLSPTTDREELVEALAEMLSIKPDYSVNDVISFDLNSVGVDLEAVDINEILAFRKEHHSEHRNYCLSAKKFTRELCSVPKPERGQLFAARQEELDDLASKLRKTARGAWKRPASFALSLAGSIWTYNTGDTLGALLAGGGAALGWGSRESTVVDAYSYLFRANMHNW